MNERHFTSTALWLSGGLLIWLANFLVVYVFAAVACAKNFAHMHWLGLPPVRLVSIVAFVLAAAATAVLLWHAHRRWSSAVEGDQRFIGFTSVACAAIAALALIWTVLPPLLLPACAGS